MEARFPNLLRTSSHRWWKPALGLSFACFLLLLLAIAVVLLTLLAAAVSDSSPDAFSRETLAPDEPLGLLANNLVIALLTPAVVLSVIVVHRQRPGLLSSVTGRLRVSLLMRVFQVALAFSVSAYLLTLWLIPVGGADGGAPTTRSTVIALLAVILLTTPLQAAGEEYGFRGYVTQALASWFARPEVGAIVAGVVTAVLFALAHGAQDPWLFSDRLVFGLVASWLVWRTGGLEAAIALHVANNLVALSTAVLLGDLDSALTSTTVDWRYAVADMLTVVLFAAVVDRLARRWSVAVVSQPSAVGYPDNRLEPPVALDDRDASG